ncbi:hypothetical protein GOODEAATRI_018785 [Goodea atripinnis]|uniref:Uncharacterized protein n=1 Tax=Goodea atripinnis TaxID=208336 RepID=A0ABV0P5Z6_9TELE
MWTYLDQDAERNPEKERERHHRAHDVISQELSERIDVEFIDEVPQTFHHVLNLLHALPLYRQKGNLPDPPEYKAERKDVRIGSSDGLSHRSIAETHGAGFAFPQIHKVAFPVNEGAADPVSTPTADFTGRVCFWEKTESSS